MKHPGIDALRFSASRRRQLLDKFADEELSLDDAKEFKVILEKDRDKTAKWKTRADFDYWFACIALIYQLDKFIIENNTPKKRIYRLLGKI